MINIPEKLWYCISVTSDDNLAYMTHYKEDSAFEKRKATGLSWASHRRIQVEPQRAIIDNSPVEGFYIAESVSRWSTSNKLFRVKDPRGFTVEVPTGNIASLLHLTTVEKGVVKEPCVWGRDGNSHVLLPVNSEPYLETLDKMDTLTKLVSVSKLEPGDVVSVFESTLQYAYLGKCKVTWKVWSHSYGTDSLWRYRPAPRETVLGKEQLIKDDKWVGVFVEMCEGSNFYPEQGSLRLQV